MCLYNDPKEMEAFLKYLGKPLKVEDYYSEDQIDEKTVAAVFLMKPKITFKDSTDGLNIVKQSVRNSCGYVALINAVVNIDPDLYDYIRQNQEGIISKFLTFEDQGLDIEDHFYTFLSTEHYYLFDGTQKNAMKMKASTFKDALLEAIHKTDQYLQAVNLLKSQ